MRVKLENGCYKIINYFDEKTKIKNITYYDSNELYHRLDGPADIIYFENGKIESKLYFIKGTTHRLDGPAMIWYNRFGKIEGERYGIDGKEYSKEEYYKQPKVIKKINIERNLKLLNKVI